MSDSSVPSLSSSDLSESPSPPAPAALCKNFKSTSANAAEASLIDLLSPLLLSSLKSRQVQKATKKSNLHAAAVTHPTPPAVNKLNNGIPLSMNHKKFITKQWHSTMLLHLIMRNHTHHSWHFLFQGGELKNQRENICCQQVCFSHSSIKSRLTRNHFGLFLKVLTWSCCQICQPIQVYPQAPCRYCI
jgi:hypothetical protein